MEPNRNHMSNDCDMSGIKPAMLELRYPPVQVERRNPEYAGILAFDYCGPVSELSAITQYINNENRLCLTACPLARTLLGIALAEMMHLQKLGELIQLLGGEVSFSARQPDRRQLLWTPDYLSLSRDARRMLCAAIEAERDAIAQYEAHMRKIKDECVNAVLRRIVRDEEYHIVLLRGLMEEL